MFITFFLLQIYSNYNIKYEYVNKEDTAKFFTVQQYKIMYS